MSALLLDTGVALLATSAPERLSKKVRRAVETRPAVLSVVSYWEVMIKGMKGTLNVGDPRQWWTATLDALAALPLHCRPEHIGALYQLPPLHQDPFDRLLIAQCCFENLTLVTTDETLPKYTQIRVLV